MQALLEIKEAKGLSNIASQVELAVNLGIDAFMATNIAQFNALEQSKKEISEKQVEDIIAYLVSQVYLAEEGRPDLYL